MVLFRSLIVILSVLFATTAYSQSCKQSFKINASSVVPMPPEAFDTGAFGGMQCRALEQYRTDIYVRNLLGISDAQLTDLAKWQAARKTYLSKIQNAEKRLADATTSAEIQAAVTVAFHYAGYGMTLAGCNPSAVTGLPALLCIGGFVFTQAGTVWSFSTMGSDKAQAQAALRDVREMLQQHDTLGAAELNEAVSKYQGEFENACHIVRTYCLN